MKLSNFEIIKNSRIAMGLGLLIISLLAATLIAKEANRTVLVWATKGELAPGELITTNDITPVSALLPESANNYLSASAQIIGGVVLRQISAGDLIPAAAVSSSSDSLNSKLIPLTVELTDMPLGLGRGDVIDIYAIAKRDSKITTPELLAANVSVSQVLERSNSGVGSILVILDDTQILSTLQLLSDSRIIVVRSI
ncbi:MAG: flagellar basal body P-ring biosynthesis protein [Actinobacteria bacterium]|nr:flagellar basal body P-ring biosynthesis protein [Actinomycetota bacterium]